MSELDDERAAHEEIAEICFACGVETDDGTSVSAVKNLAARLSRYETAMREALNVLEIPLPAGGSISDRQLSLMGSCKAATVLLCAALSDQPAAEPAGSNLEAIRRLAATLNLNPDLHSAALTDVGKENRKISEAILAILDAQPSTPSGEEMKRV